MPEERVHPPAWGAVSTGSGLNDSGPIPAPGVAGNNGAGEGRDQALDRILAAITAFREGDFSIRLPRNWPGIEGKIAEAFNQTIAHEERITGEVRRLSVTVGKEGRLKQRLALPGATGEWAIRVHSINTLIDDLVRPTIEVARAIGAVANGNLSQSMQLEVDDVPLQGEFLRSARLVNTMIDQLNGFASEVSRVAREVGTDGKLGGQAQVPGVAGTWKDLTDNVNSMASNLTGQVRNIADVTTAVARGDLSRKITVDVRGEILELKNTINTMVDQLNGFASEVSRVAREVGTEGKLGGQARAPGVAGTWKDLTDNVNLLAGNLTTQVRAIAEVATAVTKGDLTRSIQVETRGEVAELKDNINTMIANLRKTTERNQEQDWLKTNIARFSNMLQGQRDLVTVANLLMEELAPLVQAQQGAVYQMSLTGGKGGELRLLAGYALSAQKPDRIAIGEGLVGQCARTRQRILLSDVPAGYMRVSSSLGETPPSSIVILPLLFEGQVKAVIELASLHPFTPTNLAFLEQLTQSIGVVFNTIEATMRTEGLLTQSQQLTAELQSRQSELQQTNEELATKARLLAEQNAEVERKNSEVEQARRALEEKAAELALTSKYKSEFLANMSHELRTPLNSILILSQQLADNSTGNLTGRQIEFARNVNSSGSDLLKLINDILDLSKIESGTVTVEAEEISFRGLHEAIERSFRHVAENKRLPFHVEFADSLPGALVSDSKRLLQILKNLLSNAVKFTTRGHVRVRVAFANTGFATDHPILGRSGPVVAFSVEDTGIGVAPEKQRLIFEAFQQADATTSRKFGGTGLGLAISRELASLLGGEIRLVSAPGEGSTFTLYLPLAYSGPTVAAIPPFQRPTAADQVISVISRVRDERVSDDRDRIVRGEPVALIIEDDPHYARILLGLARGRGFQGIVAGSGAEGLALARQFRPAAISLDIFLPDMPGWTVLNTLKLDPLTRHIPVQVVTLDEERQHGLSHGAFSYIVKSPTTDKLDSAFDRLRKFTTRETKRLLVVGDDEHERQSIVDLLAFDDIRISAVATGSAALEALRSHDYDCVVLDLRLSDIPGLELIERIGSETLSRELPVVVFTGKDLSQEEQSQIRSMAKSIVLKVARSPERLFDETALFLHRVVADLPAPMQQMLERLHNSSEVLSGRRMLVVDDDARNIFALTTFLEGHDIDVISATNGRQAIELIETTPDLRMVLMDIMMPEMDGYQTIREVRKNPRFRTLPILALTAKAMKGDREKCLEAGASDYISKPVDTNQLLSLMRAWLFR